MTGAGATPGGRRDRSVPKGGRWLRAIGVVVLAVLLTRLDWDRLAELAITADWRCVALALLLLPPHLSLKALRWRRLLQIQQSRLGIVEAHLFHVAGMFLGLLTPGRLGEVAKVGYLVRSGVTGPGLGASSVVADRAFDLAVLGAVALAAVGSRSVRLSLAALIALGLVGAAWARGWPGSGHSGSRGSSWVRRWLVSVVPSALKKESATFVDGMTRLVTWRLLGPVGLTMAACMLYLGQCVILARGVGIQVGVLEFAAAVSVSSLISMLPVSMFGVGTRELVLWRWLAPLGVSLEQVVAYSAGELMVFYLGGAVVGSVCWWFVSRGGRTESPGAVREEDGNEP